MVHRLRSWSARNVNAETLTLFAAGGAGAGAAARLLLARLRRGARIRAGPCEAAGALLCALVGLRWSAGELPSWWLPVPLVLIALGVPLVAVDLLHRRLPDALTLPAYGLFGAVLVLAATASGNTGLLVRAAVGALVFGVAHLLVHLAAPSSLGAGDVKLAGSLGGVLGAVGWPALPVAACLAAVVTLVLAAGAALARRPAWRPGVPHGPGLLVAVLVVAVFPGSGLGVGLVG